QSIVVSLFFFKATATSLFFTLSLHDALPIYSFYEMLEEFKNFQPDFLKDKNGNDCLIPYDWTIYYLRKKALTQKIEKEELAWIILNFNQKRGYYQLRGEDLDEEKDKFFVRLK